MTYNLVIEFSKSGCSSLYFDFAGKPSTAKKGNWDSLILNHSDAFKVVSFEMGF
jgi:hypothetical protein